MDWQEIRQHYPGRWVVVKAIDAYTQGTNRIIENLEVVASFGDEFSEAWDYYKTIADGQQELYVLHTNRHELNIGVIDSFHRVLTD